ncbi:MAG: nucleoside triphosphate pyrophosphohydrolase [Thermoanaerobaculia bacterium]
MDEPRATTDLAPLLALVARLRAADGCPWDREQTLTDIRAYFLEEAHEVAAAIDEGDWQELGEELGDLLFQVAFLGRLGQEAGTFDLAESVLAVHRKMIERHPHVFGEENLADAEAVRQVWERRKLAKGGGKSLLAGVAKSMPALAAAYRLSQKAAGVGFDWPTVGLVLDKAEEEIAELRQALAEAADGKPTEAVREEIGDLLFTVANLARKLEIDPEAALAGCNLKFRRRFGWLETELERQGKQLGSASLSEMDALWDRAKVEVG